MNTFVSETELKTAEVAVIQNGTALITPQIEKYVNRYNSFLEHRSIN